MFWLKSTREVGAAEERDAGEEKATGELLMGQMRGENGHSKGRLECKERQKPIEAGRERPVD